MNENGPPARAKLAFEVEPSNRRFRLRLARYRYHPEVLSKHLPDGPSVVLDAGSGKGRLPGYWRRWGAPGKHPRIVGIDLSKKRLARSREAEYALLLEGDLRRPWPFRSEVFDAVVCEQVLEHLDGTQFAAALGEIRRILKPGGVALVGNPVFTELEVWLAPIWTRINAALRRLRGKDEASHLQHLSVRRLKRSLERSGLVPFEARGYRAFTLGNGRLEDFEWYYRFHRWFGRHAPWICGEVTVFAERPVAGRP